MQSRNKQAKEKTHDASNCWCTGWFNGTGLHVDRIEWSDQPVRLPWETERRAVLHARILVFVLSEACRAVETTVQRTAVTAHGGAGHWRREASRGGGAHLTTASPPSRARLC